ncbi:MAG: DUF4422 domain-containing protein [Lentisphaerae bacterium]|nr:DUF4422 domain-containing protein [Lentisphaerota bacterium]
MDIKIVVATHKKYQFPADDIYLPVQAGSALNPPLGYQRDDENDNISAENPHYCELTALYWAWKNLHADYYGLCHYRRYFTGKRRGKKFERIAGYADLAAALQQVPLILPKPRKYFIESNYQQYIHAHHAEDLEVTRRVITDIAPDYLAAYDQVMQRSYGSRFNMFVMRRDLFNNYCQWLFGILFELEKRLDISAYSAYDARVFGFVGERLLDVYVLKNQLAYTTMELVNLEKQCWFRKIFRFVLRKISSGRLGKNT